MIAFFAVVTFRFPPLLHNFNGLASKSTVEESDLSPALKEKLNAAASGDSAHPNKEVLDGITAEKVTAWDAKSTVYVGTSAMGKVVPFTVTA